MEEERSAHLEEESHDRLSGADGLNVDEEGVVADEAKQSILAEQELVGFLRGLHTDILRKLDAPDFNDIKHLKAEIRPLESQKRAAGVIAQAKDSRFRGVIIADPPAFGKTLSSLLVPISEMTEGSGPVVVVAPQSHTQQWVDEIHKMFEATVSVLLLNNDKKMPSTDLFNYSVVIASYDHVYNGYIRMKNAPGLLDGNDQAKNRGLDPDLSKSPVIALLSGLCPKGFSKPSARYLILDEAHTIKNVESGMYAAITKLRSHMDLCIMLTATPLEDSWTDAYAYLNLLGGHPFKSLTEMRPWTKEFYPASTRQRFAQLLDAVTLRRPLINMRAMSPVEKIVRILPFPEDVLLQSNEMFSRAMREGPEKNRGLLNDAQALLYHPSLPKLVKLQLAVLDAAEEDENIDIEQQIDANREEWKQHLAEDDEHWLSPRVRLIIDIFDYRRDCRPESVFVVVDEDYYFLHLLEVAFTHTAEPVPVFRHDDRKGSIVGEAVLEAFKEATGQRILLISPQVKIPGLDLQCANVLIQCGPWWETSWEEKAISWLYRPGQQNRVFWHSITARRSQVEQYKRNGMHKNGWLSSIVMDEVTRADDMKTCRRIM